MEFASQLKKYRTEKGFSQEELAEQIFVTRQTISNWENEKSYPDVHSLMLLSTTLSVSVDQLLKGDVERMKQEIRNEDIGKLKRMSVIYTALFALMVISAVPLFVGLGWTGVIIWIVIAGVALWYANRVEKFKKEHDIHTYKEIVAFTEGRTLDDEESYKEEVIRPYQKVFYALGAGIIAAIVCILVGVVMIIIRQYFQ